MPEVFPRTGETPLQGNHNLTLLIKKTLVCFQLPFESDRNRGILKFVN